MNNKVVSENGWTVTIQCCVNSQFTHTHKNDAEC